MGFRYDARCPSPSTKRAVIARDGMICRWCTQPVVRSQEHRPDRLHFDHVIQWSHGGPSSIDNIVVSCATCNMRRSERGGNVRSPLRDLYTYSYGIYRWCEPVTIPRVLTGMGLELGMHVANESHRDPIYTIAEIFRGRLAATNEGKILIEIGPPSSRGRGRAS